MTKVGETLLIGKDLLELLTGAMYVDPLSVIREYIQNAADGIDEASELGLYNSEHKPRIDIRIDLNRRSLQIRDNGAGIIRRSFTKRLTSLGASSKRGKERRGFRGVGRLCGLAYCQAIVFTSKSATDDIASEIVFNARELREKLQDDNCELGLGELMLGAVVSKPIPHDKQAEAHFFQVELLNVVRIKNDVLLNESEISHYLREVGPVPFDPGFSHTEQILSFINQFQKLKSYDILINDSKQPLYRPYQDRFQITEKLSDSIKKVELFDVPGIHGGTDAIGWIAHHQYFGAIEKRSGISGIRVRVGNIQIGSASQFEKVFPEPRFNSWTIGEVHILSKKLIPNGRRDDFEVNAHYENLLMHLRIIGSRIAKHCRTESSLRNKNKQFDQEFQKTNELLKAIENLPFGCADFSRTIRSIRTSIQKLTLMAGNGSMSFENREEKRNVVELEKRLATILDTGKNGFRKLPKQKRQAYIEIFDQIFSTLQPPQAKALVQQMISKLHLV